MAVKERSQIKGTDAQIKAFAGHNGVLAFATDTKSLHVLSGTAGTTTEFLPSTKVATKTELDGKLSLSGGTMTGELSAPALRFTSGNAVVGSIKGFLGNYGGLTIYGNPGLDDTWTEGAYVFLRSGNAEPVSERGKFGLVASLNSSKSAELIGTPDGSLTWGGKPVLCGESGGFPVGFLALYSGSNVPDGWFRCDGSTIADMATNYPKLYAVLGTNVLPNYSGRYPLGATTGINSLVEGGLPNIEGTATDNAYAGNGSEFSSAFKSSTFSSSNKTNIIWNDVHNQWSKFGNLVFKASDSNAVYGKSTTVTPPSVKCAFLIRHD